MWQFDMDSVANPDIPLGSSENGAQPSADVLVKIYDGNHGGSPATPDLRMLTMCHAIQCRILREIERAIGGDKDIADRMSAHNIGCGEQVLRKSKKAVEKVSRVAAGTFDLRLKSHLKIIESSDVLAIVREKQLNRLGILHRAKQAAYRMSNAENEFRRTNVVPEKKPGLARLHATFLPTSVPESQIVTPSIDDMLVIAIFGLVNPAGMYRDFDYLYDPFASASALGSLAVYERRPTQEERDWIDQARSSAAKRQVPSDIKGKVQYEGLYLDVCERVEAAWKTRSEKTAADKDPEAAG